VNNSVDYGSGAVLTDPQGWGAGSNVVQAGFINAPHTVDYLGNLKLAVERDFVSGPFSSLEFGIASSTRQKTYNIEQNFITLGGGMLDQGGVQQVAYSGSTCSPLSWMGLGAQPCYDPLDLLSNGTYSEVPTFMSSLPLPPNWKVRERDTTPYFQFNLDTQIGNIGLRGNFGMQALRTHQTSTGERVVPGSSLVGTTDLVPVVGGTTYTPLPAQHEPDLRPHPGRRHPHQCGPHRGAAAHGPDECQPVGQRRHHPPDLDRSEPGVLQLVGRQRQAAADHGRQLQRQL
jgi:iron complex outermembrane receptor protein